MVNQNKEGKKEQKKKKTSEKVGEYQWKRYENSKRKGKRKENKNITDFRVKGKIMDWRKAEKR